MLPDFPDFKHGLERQMLRTFEKLIDENAPVIARIRRHRQVEGDQFGYERDDGKLVTKQFIQLKADMHLPAEIPIAPAANTIGEHLNSAAKSMATQSEGLLFTTLEEAATSVGNHIDARGQQLDPNMIWDMIERIEIDFDHQGNPILPTVVLHPDTFASIRTRIPHWEADLGLKKRQKEIMTRKKEEWRDREGNRKLVG